MPVRGMRRIRPLITLQASRFIRSITLSHLNIPQPLKYAGIALLLWLGLGELIYWAMHRDGMDISMAGYRVMHLMQMLCLIAFAGWCWRGVRQSKTVVVAERALWLRVSNAVLLALLLSFCGDLINSFLFDLSHIVEPQTLLSVVPFMLAHILYIAAFWRLAHESERGRSMTWRLLRNPMLLAWPFLAGGLWKIVVSAEAGPLMTGLSALYALVVVLMAITALWVPLCRGRVFLLLAAGGLLFLISDSLLGAWLPAGPDRPFPVSQAIWISYFLAQCCIATVLLHSGMLKYPSGSSNSQEETSA